LQAELLHKPFTSNDLIQTVHQHSGRLPKTRAVVH
jgi:hypothetical protein